jgi:hypothetical protein
MITFYLYALQAWTSLEDYPIFERLASGGSLAISGVADVPFHASVPAESVTFEGVFTYCATPKDRTDEFPECAQPVACQSKNHMLGVVRR